MVGVVAMVVFAALLLTSHDVSQRLLGKSWKPLQRLVWFSVPLTTRLSSARGTPRDFGKWDSMRFNWPW